MTKWLLPILAVCGLSGLASADDPVGLTRLFFQDHDSQKLRWADVKIDAAGKPSLGPVADVPLPKALDAKRQKLVQMELSDGLILCGVRDDDDGKFESGWVLVHTGVGYVDHGDHGHWRYKKKPELWDARLDDKQGNPAHLYLYGRCFYLANDRLDGYTRIDPSKYQKDKAGNLTKGKPAFHKGGGNHITLAVAEDRVGYSCWIDGGGPNKGRVDVTRITPGGAAEPAYSFHLPHGGIHGATYNSGKVLFAPSDGVCWVEADLECSRQPEQVKPRHIPLGQDSDKPRRTGAFTTHGRIVLFVTGKEEKVSLVLLDAKEAEPKPVEVPIEVKKGNRVTTPEVVKTKGGDVVALIFHDHEAGVDAADSLTVIQLDPDGDKDYRDAKVVKTLPVGNSAVKGHFGHHGVAFDAAGEWAFITNPGDGTISALSLKDWKVKADFKVGGMPTAVLAYGAAEDDD